MKTRCKMVVNEIDKREDCTDIKMAAVGYENKEDGSYEPPEENKKFFAFTPAGDFSATVKNEFFKDTKVGDEFYIDVIPAKK